LRVPTKALCLISSWGYCRLTPPCDLSMLVRGCAGGSVRHGVGFHFAPSGSFLNCVLRYSGPLRYIGSSSSDDTTSQTSPFGAVARRSKCSTSVAFSLYGTPLFRR